MREIKFRCWQIDDWGLGEDDEEKPIWKMIQPEDLAFEKYEPIVDLLKSDPESEVFMQYTGLKDKNGKEIYEGDIMCWGKYEGTKYQTRWVVEFNPHQAYKTWSSTSDEAEIIGNIYENPELLTSEPNDKRSVATEAQ